VSKGKISREASHERLRFVLQLLSRHVQKGEIKRFMRKKYGCCGRTTERYLARARELLIRSTGETSEFLRAQALALYEDVIRDPESTIRDRLIAQVSINHLLGLNAPCKRHVAASAEISTAKVSNSSDQHHEQHERCVQLVDGVLGQIRVGN
jgi:hypothetical protein